MDSDVHIQIVEDEDGREDDVRLRVQKNRQGKRFQEIPLRFNGEFMAWSRDRKNPNRMSKGFSRCNCRQDEPEAAAVFCGRHGMADTTTTNDTELNGVVEQLIMLALKDTAQARQSTKRRPTWAPFLAFPPELTKAIEDLWALEYGSTGSTESKYGRLWAEWSYDGGFKPVGFTIYVGDKHKSGAKLFWIEKSGYKDGGWFTLPGRRLYKPIPLRDEAREWEKEHSRKESARYELNSVIRDSLELIRAYISHPKETAIAAAKVVVNARSADARSPTQRALRVGSGRNV
jgi:hypothetical protein